MNAEKILVLKSNVATLADLARVRQPLDHHPGIRQWNIDLDDCDHVLRIVTPNLTISDIEDLITRQGYRCSELE